MIIGPDKNQGFEKKENEYGMGKQVQLTLNNSFELHMFIYMQIFFNKYNTANIFSYDFLDILFSLAYCTVSIQYITHITYRI